MHIGLRFNIAEYLIFGDIARILYLMGYNSARIKIEMELLACFQRRLLIKISMLPNKIQKRRELKSSSFSVIIDENKQ